jgi:hypothetical protein
VRWSRCLARCDASTADVAAGLTSVGGDVNDQSNLVRIGAQVEVLAMDIRRVELVQRVSGRGKAGEGAGKQKLRRHPGKGGRVGGWAGLVAVATAAATATANGGGDGSK